MLPGFFLCLYYLAVSCDFTPRIPACRYDYTTPNKAFKLKTGPGDCPLPFRERELIWMRLYLDKPEFVDDLGFLFKSFFHNFAIVFVKERFKQMIEFLHFLVC